MTQLYGLYATVRGVRDCTRCTDCTILYVTVYPYSSPPLTIPLKRTTPRVTGVLVALDNDRTVFERGRSSSIGPFIASTKSVQIPTMRVGLWGLQ
jgi:hypothetical protein